MMDAEKELYKQLEESLDAQNWSEVMNKQFMFTATHGSHSHALVGNITGISWSDEAGLELYVSVPRIWGKPLECLQFDPDQGRNGGWSARMTLDDSVLQKQLESLRDRRPGYGTMAEAMIEKHEVSKYIPGILRIYGR